MLRNLLCATVVFALSACAATATYPPTAGKATVTGNTPPLPQVMASSLRYAQQIGRAHV